MKKLLLTSVIAVSIFTGCNSKYQCVNPKTAHDITICSDVKKLD